VSTSTTTLQTPDDDLGLDLDAARTARAEKQKIPPHIKIDGQQLDLPRELPVDVLAPLTEINVDISVFVRMAMDAYKTAQDEGEDSVDAVIDAVIDIFAANPDLPTKIISAVKLMALRLFGQEGYDLLIAARPSVPELGAIAKFAGRKYGVGLGEALPSSDSSEGTGTTSKATSKRSTTSTSGTSGSRRRTPTS